ncbi:hypothetical protein L249_7458 [Ophiocordyceps polyrhachis-furcata BCC 54312]|uniref:Uncharacterized protein n=1 Tax=Ophiocordyceps polyrhachis-furcata BCC 54312 TaxID=1330021 RepID=A0A367LBS9_9HYPO|nr:hypothetical protein L249_7458 [Ophiocordyceps polyrhachis-furcata BCC 54312]
MIWEGIHAQSPIGIVIAARELGKSDFLSVGHDFSMRKNVGKKWVCLLKSVGKVESNEVFCGAMEEEEGGEKLVESLLFAAVEMMMSNQGVDHVIEKKKTNHVMVVLSDKVEADNELEVGTSKGDLEEDFNVMDQPDDLTLRYDRYWYSAPIDVQRADRYNESIGRYDRYSPTVTQGVVAGLRPN